MSGMLNLIDRLLAMGRNLHKFQQNREALHCLGRLAAFHELPPEVAEEAQVCLAEIHLKRRRYRHARRHLSIALLYRPDSGRYHYLMATALAKGRHAEPERAIEHYRRSLECDPDQPGCLAEFGWLCVYEGKIEEGLGALSRAVQLTPNDPNVVVKLVKGLCRAGRAREAKSVLRSARFRNPRDARFRRLWNNFLFRRVYAKQRAALRTAGSWTENGGPVLLPFLQPETAKPASGIRKDETHPLPGPHQRRPLPRSDWKHG